ncbi:MAG TPA: GNAT family N-acetyltransferase [Egibacteraceae bacterium]|nr:GNAT family N-acetyltransferase [Egibacteraceae bacterium]
MEADVGDVTIRPAREDEIDDVMAIVVDAYAEYAATMSPDVWSSVAMAIATLRGSHANAEPIVAEVDGKPLGTVTIYRDAHEGEEEFGVRLLSVHPSARHRGLGRALMRYCADRAREEGRKRIVLTTHVEMDSAHRLCREMGFARDRKLDHDHVPGVRLEGYALDL